MATRLYTFTRTMKPVTPCAACNGTGAIGPAVVVTVNKRRVDCDCCNRGGPRLYDGEKMPDGWEETGPDQHMCPACVEEIKRVSQHEDKA